MLKKTVSVLSVLLMTSLGVGCVAQQSAQVPPQAYVKPRQTIAAVDEMEPENNPNAKLYLQLAKREVDRADRYMKNGEEDKARLALLRAEADAQLALSLMKEAKTQQEAEAIEAEIDEMQSGLRR